MKKRFFVIPLLGAVLLLSLGLIAGLGNGSIGAANGLDGSALGAERALAAPTGATEPPAQSSATAEYIGWSRAKEIVFTALGVSEAELRDVDYDFERGRYEIDFDHGGYEYEYEVDALTGEIVKNRAVPDDDYRTPVESAPVESAPVESVPAASEPPAESAPAVESVPTEPAPQYIGLDKAKEIVFAALGVSEAEIRDVDYDLERGRYEIDFDHGGYEYEYEVDAVTGDIVRAEKEWDD